MLAAADPSNVVAKNDLAISVYKIAEMEDARGRFAEAVPVGAYTRQVLANLSRAPGFDPEFGRRVLANVVSHEENVRAVLGKVQLGEADAGFVYRSDVTPALERVVRALPIADSLNVFATYPVAVLRQAPRAALARDFVARLGSPEGRAILAKNGLVVP